MKRVGPVIFSIGLAAAGSAKAQPSTEILGRPLSCWPTNQFLVVESAWEAPADVQTVKLYFRSLQQPDYYYVEMTIGRGGDGRLILPKAAASSREVVYYLELVTRSFSAFRSGERNVPVTSGSDCRALDPAATFYTGHTPDITVGAVRPGAAAIPPGFRAEGISRFVNAWGSFGEAAAGGGSGAKTIALIGGIGGGAAAAAFAAGGSPGATAGGSAGTTSTTAALTSSSTAAGSSSTTSAAGGAGSTSSTTSIPGSSTTSTVTIPPTTTSLPAPSTTTSIGSSTTTIGSSTTTGPPTTSQPPTTVPPPSTTSPSTTTRPSTTTLPSTTSSAPSSSTSSVSSSTTSVATTTTSISTTTVSSSTTTAAGNTSDLRVTKSAHPNPAKVGQNLEYTIAVTNLGPARATGVLVDDTLPSAVLLLSINNPSCALAGPARVICNLGELASGAGQTLRITVRPSAPGSITNRVTVDAVQADPNPSNDAASVTTGVNALTSRTTGEVRVTYKSSLHAEPAGRIRARIVLNDTAVQETDDSGEFVLTAPARSGVNRIEGQYSSARGASGAWRFDFGATPGFVAGSLQVEGGSVLSLDARGVVFALGRGAPGPRFTFALEEFERGSSGGASGIHPIFTWVASRGGCNEILARSSRRRISLHSSIAASICVLSMKYEMLAVGDVGPGYRSRRSAVPIPGIAHSYP